MKVAGINTGEHECSWDSVEWETIKGIPYYFIGGLGETLERIGKCRICGKTFREIYIHSCIKNDATEEIVSL